MHRNLKIGVVVPAFNEESLIEKTLRGMSSVVDRVFVVEDGSTDQTGPILSRLGAADRRISVIRHAANQGLGQSLIDGYVASLDSDVDITAVMAGDNQMHPDDLLGLIDRLIDDRVDYVKGNRLLHQSAGDMPRHRLLGNSILTILTKFATGYYAIMDPQCGYTVIRNSILRRIPIREMTTGYGYNADILCMLNIQGFKAIDAEVRAVYAGEKSKIRLWKYIPKTSCILTRLFFRRLWKRYIVLDFHPLVLFYLFAFLNLLGILVPFTIRFFWMWSKYGELPKTTLTVLVFTALITFQSILFAIWMDMDYNRNR